MLIHYEKRVLSRIPLTLCQIWYQILNLNSIEICRLVRLRRNFGLTSMKFLIMKVNHSKHFCFNTSCCKIKEKVYHYVKSSNFTTQIISANNKLFFPGILRSNFLQESNSICVPTPQKKLACNIQGKYIFFSFLHTRIFGRDNVRE